MRFLSLSFFICLLGLAPQLWADGVLKGQVERSDFIQTAKVWTAPAFEIGRLDLSQSPLQCPAFETDQVVSCSYKKPKRGDDTGGLTPKFKCKTAEGKTLKVKYGRESAETFTEVFSSRLLLALGFYADCNYPVAKVICTDCPANPDRYTRDYASGKEDPAEVMEQREFNFAMIEEKFGEEIVAEIDGKVVEGWGFNEILQPELQADDASQQAAREALTILMAILQHGDNRLSNQRFYCRQKLAEDGSCAPDDRVLVVQDLGATLGGYKVETEQGKLLNLPPTLAHRFWDFAPVWNLWRGPGLSACTVQVFAGETPEGPASLTQQKVSEEGRLFLANLLSQLRKEQIEQLVLAAKLNQWTGSPNITGDAFGELERQINFKLPFRPTISAAPVATQQWVDTLWKKFRSVTANGVCR